MDLLRASSNFLNIHGAWVLGGLIAAGLIKHQSNQKKQRAENDESDDTTPTPTNPCPRCEGAAGFPKEFYFHPKRLDFIPCRNCIEMGGYCPGCMEVLPGLTRDRDPWEAFYDGCGKCGWSWDDATAIRPKTTQWSVHLDHPGAQRWFSSEQDAYAYAYNDGHRDSRVGGPYKPLLAKAHRDTFRNIVRQKAEGAESFDADEFEVRGDRTVEEDVMLVLADEDEDLTDAQAIAKAKEIMMNDRQLSDYGEVAFRKIVSVDDDSIQLQRMNYDAEDEVIKKCQRCDGTAKMVGISAKCSDLYHQVNLKTGKEYDGYVPDWIGTYGDYVDFTICRHCGQVQGEWPELDATMNQFKSGKAITSGFDAEDECSVCDGLGWRYVEDDDGESVRAPCYECGGGKKGSPTGEVAFDAISDDYRIAGRRLNPLSRHYIPPDKRKKRSAEGEAKVGPTGPYYEEQCSACGSGDFHSCWECDVKLCIDCDPYEMTQYTHPEERTGSSEEDLKSSHTVCATCVDKNEGRAAEGFSADTYDQATHGPYLPVGAVKRFLARMPPREEFYVTFVKSNNDVREMECFLTKPYDPDNDTAGVMELGGSRAIFKRFRTDRVISIYR